MTERTDAPSGAPPADGRARWWRRPSRKALAATVAAGMLVLPAVGAGAQDAGDDGDGLGAGNFIFIHPDGTDQAMWHTARVYYEGPDGSLQWDRLPASVNYRGHMADELTATSNGGATVHAFGFKVDGPDSFGQDTGAENVLGGDVAGPDTPEGEPQAREILGLSGYPGSWLREAANAGLPTGTVNDGDASEPGTAVFYTEVGQRGGGAEFDVVRQFFDGRPGFEDVDEQPVVIMAGGEALFVPADLEYCDADDAGTLEQLDGAISTYPLDCVVHRPAEDYTENVDGEIVEVDLDTLPDAPETDTVRPDGRNLLEHAANDGYVVIRTRAEFDALVAAVGAGDVDPAELKILALFADEDIFNDTTEETLIAEGLVDPTVPRDAKDTNLILYGAPRGTPGYDPPTPAEMADVALLVLSAHSEAVGLPYATVWEVEGTDNYGNSNNTIGTLFETKQADDMIGVARQYVGRDPDTTILTAADSTAGGMHIVEYQVPPDAEVPETTGFIGPNLAEADPRAFEGFAQDNPANPFVEDGDIAYSTPVDGRYGRDTEPFLSEPDQFGQELPFGVGWVATPDFGGGIVTRAEGQYADVVDSMYDRFDNIDVYRVAYLSLFGDQLPYPDGVNAPTRPDDFDPSDEAQTPGVPGDGLTPPNIILELEE